MTQSNEIAGTIPRVPRGAGRPGAGSLLAALWLALFLCVSAGAGASEVFTVDEVNVDATAETASAARDQALAEGQRKAFERLLSRIALAGDRARLPAPGSEEISDLVGSIEVSDERTSAVRYLATMTVRFRPDAVRTFLRGAGVGFAETASRPLLVLPVYEVAGALSLWDDPNPWREAWSGVRLNDGLVPLVRPTGDLQDIAAIGAEQAVRGDDARLKAVARRYGAADVLVARAGMRFPDAPMPGGGPWLQVTLSRFGNALLENTRVEAFYPQPGEDMNVLLARAASAIAEQVEETWKRNNRLRFDTGDEVMVEVPIDSLGQWLEIKAKLDAVPFIRRSDLMYLTRSLAWLRLNFIGDEEQLRLALSQSDLTLEQGATSLVLRRGRPPVGSGAP